MDNDKICKADPKADNCDVVTYAQKLVDKDEAGRPDMTVGKQPGYSKDSIEEITRADKP